MIENKPIQPLLVDKSMGSDITNSNAGNVGSVLGYSVQIIWTAGASPVGTAKLQASDNGIDWDDIANSAFSISSNSGNKLINVSGVYYNFVQVVYARTSGTATMNANLVSKD